MGGCCSRERKQPATDRLLANQCPSEARIPKLVASRERAQAATVAIQHYARIERTLAQLIAEREASSHETLPIPDISKSSKQPATDATLLPANYYPSCISSKKLAYADISDRSAFCFIGVPKTEARVGRTLEQLIDERAA